MKKLQLLIMLLCVSLGTMAQQNFPAKAIGRIGSKSSQTKVLKEKITTAVKVASLAKRSGANNTTAIRTALGSLQDTTGLSVINTAIDSLFAVQARNGSLSVSQEDSVVTSVSDTATVHYTSISSATLPSFQRFAAYGIGDVNTQSLTQINASGKLAVMVIPFVCHTWKRTTFVTSTYLAFNVNASNKDTLIEGNILFPDLGNAGLLGTIEFGFLSDTTPTNNVKYYYGLLGEFASKRVTAKGKRARMQAVDSADVMVDTSAYFNVVNITAGLKGGVYFNHITSSGKSKLISLTGLLYYNYAHVPDKDINDYRFMLQQPKLSNSFNSLGFKVTVGIDNLQFFADLRHTWYKGDVLDRDLASFNSNIGVILPIEINLN